MLRYLPLCAALSFVLVPLGFAERPILVRDGRIATVNTFQGLVAPRIVPVFSAPDVTVAVLADGVSSQELPRLRRAIAVFLTPAVVAKRPIRVIIAGPASTDVSPPLSTSSELQAALRRLITPSEPASSAIEGITRLGDLVKALPSNWAQTIVIGHLPQVGPDETWVSAWIGEAFRNRRVRVSFWSLDESVPRWAFDASASTLGNVAALGSPALALNLDENASPRLFELTWETKIAAGALVYPADLKLANGEHVLTVQAMASAPGYVLPLEEYAGRRAAMATSSGSDEMAAQAVLAINPADPEALRRVAVIRTAQNRHKEAEQLWKQLSEIEPQNGEVWANWGISAYAVGDFDISERALARAAVLGAKGPLVVKTMARLRMRQRNYSPALEFLKDVLRVDPADQEAWLLRADCAQHLDHWSMEADSLERAISRGPVPFARRTELIGIYLGHSAPNRAIPHLKAATSGLPHECAITAQYAEFWEEAGDPVRAEELWKTALALNPNYEPAVFGFAKHLMHANRAVDALRFVDRGLESTPDSVRFSLLKTEALEALQQFYAARRLVSSSKSTDLEILKRRARLEDWYGSDVSNSYSALVQSLVEERAPSADIVSACRRGLEVSLRCGRLKDAQAFADQLAAMGDNTGRKMLQPNPVIKSESTQLVGGVDALGFLLTNQNKSRPEHFLVDYSRVLNSLSKADFQTAAAKVHEYFQQVAALAALGTRKPDRIELCLSLNDKSAKRRTEQVLRILDLKLDRGKQTLAVRSIEKKSQARKQEGTAALAIDTQSIEEALAERKPYMLEIPVDRVPVFPSEDLWKKAFFEHQQYPGDLAEGLVTDPRLPRIYYALNAMDREAARVLVQSMALRTLAENYSIPLSLFSAALAIRDKHVELPGGRSAQAVWSSLVGANPSDPAAFFRALLKRDDGRLLAFFYTLSQLDSAHQRFFTRSAERTKRFYEYFRDSTEMKRGFDHPLGTDTFAQFLSEVPLNEDGNIDFPGGAEVWMVAKGQKHSSASVARLAKKVRRAVAPDDEDEILIRLAGTEYKAEVGHKSELANFIAVVRLDRERKTPMDTETALLLAQNYSAYGDLYPYFASLGDLGVQDYQSVFDLVERLEALDPVTANIRMGELHSFLAMLTIVGRSGASDRQSVRQMLRKGLDRYLHAKDAWTDASLSFLEDLTSLCNGRSSSTDAKLRTVLLGNPSQVSVTLPEGEVAIDPIGRRHKSFREVLKLQNVPSLDVIFAIVRALANIRQSRRTDVVDTNLAKFVARRAPNDWKLVGDEQKGVDRYEVDTLRKASSRLAQLLRKRKPNWSEIDKLSVQMTADLEPWIALAMAGQIYAWYFDPTDLIVSEDPALLRKHRFVELSPVGKRKRLVGSGFVPQNDSEGSYFVGGFARFSLFAGQVRASGNHLSGPATGAFGAAIVASVRGTDWRPFTESALQSFSARVRIAREWIVQSTVSAVMWRELEEQTAGLLSLTRRKTFLEAISTREWNTIWESVSLSDLYFLGDALLAHAPADLWNSPALRAMKRSAGSTDQLDILGPVAPALDGCTAPHLRRYQPYEEYEPYAIPTRIAQRAAELKLYLAWQADSEAWPPEAIANIAPSAADAVLKKLVVVDSHDWSGVLKAYEALTPDILHELVATR